VRIPNALIPKIYQNFPTQKDCDKFINTGPMTRNELKKIVSQFEGAEVFVLGDIILDEFIWGEVSRISPEAPVPVVNMTSFSKNLGGAGNVVNNLCALRAKVTVSGVVGDDAEGRAVLEQLKRLNVSTDGVFVEKERPTTLKTRIIALNQQVVRIDKESAAGIKTKTREKIIDYVKENVGKFEGVIISDYAKGVISKSLLREVIPLLRKKGKIVAVDPKIKNFPYYRGASVVTPNQKETEAVLRYDIEDLKGLNRAGRELLKYSGCEAVLITRGKEGMSIFERSGQATHIPAVAKEVYDVTGAGDTVISTFTLALMSGGKPKEAAVLSNYAASVVVGKVGTATLGVEELLRVIDENI